MTSRLRLIFLAALGLSFSVHAADGAGITLRLLACKVGKEQPPVVLATKDGKSDAFELASSTLSAPMVVAGRAVELRSADDNRLLSEITLPDQGASFVALLAPQEPSGFVATVVRLDDGSFQAGDYCFFNGAEKTVVVQLGGTEVVVDAGTAVMARPHKPEQNHHYNVTMSVRNDSGDKIFASTRWPLNQAVRSYIMLQAKSSGRITYHSVDQAVEKP